MNLFQMKKRLFQSQRVSLSLMFVLSILTVGCTKMGPEDVIKPFECPVNDIREMSEDCWDQSERFARTRLPDILAPGTGYPHFYWCVWHEGLKVYPTGAAPRIAPKDFLKKCLDLHSHDASALREMTFLNSPKYMPHLLDGMSRYFEVAGNGGYNVTQYHLCLAKRRSFPSVPNTDHGTIRKMFPRFDGNPNVRNLLATLQNSTITYMLNTCP